MGGLNYTMPKGIPRNQSMQRKILHRLKIARGHLDKVIGMVDADEYCVDVIHQSMAVQSALRQIDHVILKNHMETCVADSIKQGKTEEVVDEVMKVVERS